jgi:DNA ligase-1
MQRFAELYWALEQASDEARRRLLLTSFLHRSDPGESAWAIWLLSQGQMARIASAAQQKRWFLEDTGFPEWLFSECSRLAADVLEVISLILPAADSAGQSSVALSLPDWIEQVLEPLWETPAQRLKTAIFEASAQMTIAERTVFHRLLTGRLKSVIADAEIVGAVSQLSGLPADVIACRMATPWKPVGGGWEWLINLDSTDIAASRPYPLAVHTEISGQVHDPGTILPDEYADPSLWSVEQQYLGQRVQLIRRGGQTVLWDSSGKQITGEWPQLTKIGTRFPEGTVIEAMIVSRDANGLRSCAPTDRMPNTRIGKQQSPTGDFCLLVLDLLEDAGVDRRNESYLKRRRRLETLLAPLDRNSVVLSQTLPCDTWQIADSLRSQTRSAAGSGLWLRRLSAAYSEEAGTYIWRAPPFRCRAVLIYVETDTVQAQKRLREMTFAVWHQGQLVPIAKTSADLAPKEKDRVTELMRTNRIRRYGPVHSVKADLVFELSFDGLQIKTRNPGRLSLCSPRIESLCENLEPHEADSLETIQALTGFSEPVDVSAQTDDSETDDHELGGLFAAQRKQSRE